MDTVTARRTLGSVAYYVDLLGTEFDPGDRLLLKIIDGVLNHPVNAHLSAEDRVADVRNLLAAAAQIRAGLAGR